MLWRIESLLEIFFKILIGIVLFSLAVIDLYRKEVPFAIILILGISVIAARIILGNFSPIYIAGLSLGAAMLEASFITKEKLGYADGLIILVLGFYFGLNKIIWLMFYASIIMTVVSVYLLVSKKGKMESSVAFIPALFLGYLLV